MATRAKPPAKPKLGTKIIKDGDVGVTYSRYSSSAQREVSIEQQEEKALDYAKSMGIPIVEMYADRAVSGRSDKRKDFQRMLRDAAKGKFQYVIAWKSTRIGRNMLEAMVNEAKLNECGVRVLYVEEDFDDSAAGRFAARSMMNVNQFYSENMAEDVKRGMEYNANNCLSNGNPPLGYKRGEDGRYAIDEPKAELVREIFGRVACGEPLADIARDLNIRGIKTKRGGEWNKSSFHVMLRNERYRGIYIYGDIRIEGGMPRIVSDELFFRVQEVLNMKTNVKGRHRADGDYLLTGKLFCGHCNSPMTGISGTSKTGAMHFYYSCRKRQTEKSCHKANVRRDKIELAVATAIRNYILQEDVIEWIADSTVARQKQMLESSRISVLEGELADVRKSIKNLMNAIEMGIITETTKGRLMELEGEQARLSARISAEQGSFITITKDRLVSWIMGHKDGDIHNKAYQARLFDTFLVSVHVYDDHLKIVFSFTGNKNSISVPLDASVVENIENDAGPESSFKLSYGVPKETRSCDLVFFGYIEVGLEP